MQSHKFIIILQQAKAEQEEEYISNTLMKKINSLKKEKEMLAVNYEHEEEFLTNDLTRKLNQVFILNHNSCASLISFKTLLIDYKGVNKN